MHALSLMPTMEQTNQRSLAAARRAGWRNIRLPADGASGNRGEWEPRAISAGAFPYCYYLASRRITVCANPP
jgi:hypothetical protein